MSGVVWRIVNSTYHSSVECSQVGVMCMIVDHWRRTCCQFGHAVDCTSRLSGSVELTLRYTTPDIHCRHRSHECDGGINVYLLLLTVIDNAYSSASRWSRYIRSLSLSLGAVCVCVCVCVCACLQSSLPITVASTHTTHCCCHISYCTFWRLVS